MSRKSRGLKFYRMPVEALERRQLLAAEVIPGQWILRVNGVNGDSSAQVKKLDALISKAHGDTHATRWLGKDGLALVESPKHLNHGQIKKLLATVPGFVSVEPDYVVKLDATVNDPQFSSLWGLHNTGQSGGTADADIDVPEAWDITKGNGTVVIGDIDTGVDWTHPDLAGSIWTNPGEIAGNGIDDDNNGYKDDIHGWNFINNTANALDDNNHGSHTSGTIAATQNNAVGVAGVANAKIMALKFLSAAGSGSTAGAIAAVNYATMMKQTKGINVRATSNSWGGGGFSQELLNAINAGGAQGILFIAAAGNSALNTDVSPEYPAAYNTNHIISVAATDRNDLKASFSNYGATTVDLGAPGVAVTSTTRNNTYSSFSGTSMATPHVAGVAALLFSAKPTATTTEVKNAILNGVDQIASMNGKTVSGGRLNALKSLQLITASPPSPPPPSPPPPSPPPPAATPTAPTGLIGATISRTRIDLSWTDRSGNETGFKIERSTNGTSFTQIATVGANAQTYSATGLRKNRTYWFRVRAYNGTLNSTYSNVVSNKTLRSFGDESFPASVTWTLLSDDSGDESAISLLDGL